MTDNILISDILADIRKKKRQSGLANLEVLKTEFKNKNFHKIRHQSVAHKNKLLKEPAGSVDLYLNNKVISGLGEIIKKLCIQSYFWFDYELWNPNILISRNLYTLLK